MKRRFRSPRFIRTLFIAAAFVLVASPLAAQKVETGFLDRAVVVNETEYRYQVFVPREFTRTRTWPVIIVLHGGGTYGSDGIRPTEGGLGRVIRSSRRRLGCEARNRAGMSPRPIPLATRDSCMSILLISANEWANCSAIHVLRPSSPGGMTLKLRKAHRVFLPTSCDISRR